MAADRPSRSNPGVPYRYWPREGRPAFEWPDGKRLAVYVGLNIEHFELGKPATAIFPPSTTLELDPLNYGWRDYGTRVGVWRLIDLLDAHEIRASVLLNADVCDQYPQIIEAGIERRWAWCGHGRANSSWWTGMEIEEERAALAEIVDTLTAATGSSPRGWLGPALTETPNTVKLLAEQGFTYVMDWPCDDEPFPLDPEAAEGMISVPYSVEVNDAVAILGWGMGAEDFSDMIRDQFEVLHREARQRGGAVMPISLHPFIVGHPFRIKYLERALAEICSHDDVWVTTSDEIAAWYLEHEYERALNAPS